MNVLLTGAFGNIGRSTLDELIRRGYRVRCFDMKTRANQRAARPYRRKVEIFWGDLRNPQDVQAAVQGQEVVLHVAFVIPKLSATGVGSEEHPEWARAINVGGTENLIHALQAMRPSPRLLFTSSLHVYGLTQDQPPPRTVLDPPHPIEHYAHHKVECEEMVRASGLKYTIFRLGAALPVRLVLDPGMFDVPLENRIEFVHTRDVGLAIANSIECDAVWGQTLHIGGGERCQVFYRQMMETVLDASGVGALPDKAFASVPFATDWLDTRASQALLKYQRYTLADYAKELKGKLGWLRQMITAFRPLVRRWLLSYSPYLR